MALLEAAAVTVQFGGVTAVDNASLTVDEGSITGLIGPNGAGKTTLFNVITGLQPPTKGRVRFRGQDVTRASVNSRAKAGMGRTFQRLEAFGSLTVRENIQAARDIHGGPKSWFAGSRQDKTVDRLIDRVGVRPYADQRADSVPTGVARLVEMARALAIEPRLLLLDEPSSGLDESETEAFGDLLRDLAGDGTAILMVEHDMDLVMSVCELIHVLEFGRVIATGTPREIRADRTVQAAYLGFVEDTEPASSARHDLDPGEGTADFAAVPSAPSLEPPAEPAAEPPAEPLYNSVLERFDDVPEIEQTIELPAVRHEPDGMTQEIPAIEGEDR